MYLATFKRTFQSDDLLITPVGTVVVDIPNAEAANLTIQDMVVLQINPNQSLTVNGTIANNSSESGLIIKSDETGTGSLIAGFIPGLASVERYMTGNAWHSVSPSATGTGISSFIQNENNSIPNKSGSYGMMDYNESSNQWNAYYTAATSENLTAGKGYSIRRSSNQGIPFYLFLQRRNRGTR